MTDIIRNAQCSCGAVKVRCAGEPLSVSICHCQECKRRTGSAFGIAAFFNAGDVQIEGKSSSYTRPSESGFEVAFHFCHACGSTVYWFPKRLPDLIAVASGAFGDTDFPVPTQSVYEWARCSWLDEEIPKRMD
jgi:hypothetical protein